MYANNAQGDGRVCAEIFIEEPNAKFLTEGKLAWIENKKQSELSVTQIAGFVLFCQCCLIFDIAQKIVLGWYYEKNAKHSW